MSRPTIAFRQQLDSVPLRNRRARVEREADGTLAVTVDLSYPAWMKPFRAWLHLRPTARYRLDRIGTEVYDSIDGVATFEALVDQFAARHQLTFFESRALMMNYFQLLMKRGMIVIGVQRPAQA